jgi:hypothetical protein
MQHQPTLLVPVGAGVMLLMIGNPTLMKVKRTNLSAAEGPCVFLCPV